VRKVRGKQRTGEVEEVEQYYHRYRVALLLGPVMDAVLGIKPVLNQEARGDIDLQHVGHERRTDGGEASPRFLAG